MGNKDTNFFDTIQAGIFAVVALIIGIGIVTGVTLVNLEKAKHEPCTKTESAE